MKKKSELQFETALGRLEEIVQKLEAGDAELDESLKLFEEGVELIGVCQRKFDEVKEKVEILSKQGTGNYDPKPE